MTESVQFRSAVNGFNRNDVMNYINTLLTEKEELQKKLNEITAENTELVRKEKELSEKFNSSLSRCDNCSIKRDNEAKIGSAMLDARRFSEVLVRESEEKALGVYNSTVEDVKDALKIGEEMSTEIKKTGEEFLQVFEQMQEKTDLLCAQLQDFYTHAQQKQGEFVSHCSYEVFEKESRCVFTEKQSEAAKKQEKNKETNEPTDKNESDAVFEPNFRFLSTSEKE